MPMTVITLSNVPPSLKGDLTKWMQEIATGVFIGNFNIKIREQLWERIKSNIHEGQATLSYRHINEQGYQFETYNTFRQKVNYDGIELVLIPNEENKEAIRLKKGFSNASKNRKVKLHAKKSLNHLLKPEKYIVLDLETDGLQARQNRIIEIGVLKVTGEQIEKLNVLIKTENPLPEEIEKLTGITREKLDQQGIPIQEALNKTLEFIGSYSVIGYNVNFDMEFLNSELKRAGKDVLQNKSYDLMRYIKKKKQLLDNYRLSTVLKEYKIDKKVPHRALEDAEIIHELANKVNGFLDAVKKGR